MKNFLITLFTVLAIIFSSCQKNELQYEIESNEKKSNLKFDLAIKTKTLEAKLVNNGKRLDPRSSHTSVVFDNKMWIIAGSTNGVPRNDVLWSSDGKAWNTTAARKSRFPARRDHASVVFDGKMWVFGGRNNSDDYALNDIWSSQDGTNWVLETGDADFEPRYSHTVTEFNGYLWLIGGATVEPFQSDAICCGFNDVWRSTDGVNWTKVYDHSSGNNMIFSHGTTVIDHKLVVVGGNHYGGGHPIRYSENGTDWNGIKNVEPEFLKHQVENIKETLWVTAGNRVIENSPDLTTDEIWYSSNGLNWLKANLSQKFPARKEHTSLFFKNKLWIINGNDSNHNDLGDVWSFSSSEFSEEIDGITIGQ